MKEYDFYSTPIDLNIDANGNIFTTIALSLSLSLSLSLCTFVFELEESW